MRTSRWIDLLLIGVFASLTTAHSQRRGRLTYISEIDEPRINTPSGRVHAHSSFDLYFTLHRGDQDVRLTLEPNDDLIPDEAVVTYHNEDGSVNRVEPLKKREHKVFKGKSWLRDEMGWYWSGWARVMVMRDGIDPLFEGAFSLHHNTHHIQLKPNFRRTRHELDPLDDANSENEMIVYRDSDIEPGLRTQGLFGRGTIQEDPICPADKMAFNTALDHPVNRMILEQRPKGFWGSMEFENMFGGAKAPLGRRGMTKRQSVTDEGTYGSSGNSAGVNLKNSIGSTSGCPKSRRVALVGVATDCTYTGDFENEAAARANIISQLNVASDLYEQTFNLTLGLSKLSMSPSSCPSTAPDSAKWNLPCSNSAGIEQRLSLFSEWRGAQPDDGLALWTLLTTCETGSAVGLAWMGQLCVGTASDTGPSNTWVSGTNIVARTVGTEWKVIAHEIAHTMGAVHDCNEQSCASGTTAAASMCCPLSAGTCNAGGDFIMNPTTTDKTNKFSPCTIGNICSAFGRRSVDTSCLTSNKNVTILTTSQCGNGLVEADEECDCGSETECGANSCCNPKTCKFQDNAVCDDTNDDCCESCQFKSANSICRASTGECDPEEKCTGRDANCPKDTVANDGTGCGNGLQCASGQCTSRDMQCKTVMGHFNNGNDTRACDTSNCVISCFSPEFDNNMCQLMEQNFLDGTPCEGDGKCNNGRCRGSTPLGEVKSWINSHKNIVIGVGAGVGGLILLMILCCCCSRCRRRQPKRIPVQQQPQGWQAIPPGTAPSSGYEHHGHHRGNSSQNYQQPSYQQAPVRYA
ncbi:Metallo-peptidase family M12-domain-containing protein [Geopyxis carbonaria]|nr:Metallo-peptidase family M12-domain-containing protein [Geopyxis carbonaria]